MAMRSWFTAKKLGETNSSRLAVLVRVTAVRDDKGHCGFPRQHSLVTVTRASSTAAGQPTPETHPHLLQLGELTAGFAADEYRRRRRYDDGIQ